jgi:hypothetical protein
MNKQEKVAYIFKAIDASGIYMVDFARITGISRESLYRWKKGMNVSDMLRLNMAYKTAERLEKLCRDGLLPLADSHRPEKRLQVLRMIIKDSMKNANQPVVRD